MLVLARKKSQWVLLRNPITGDEIRIQVRENSKGNTVRLGLLASNDWQIDRLERAKPLREIGETNGETGTNFDELA